MSLKHLAIGALVAVCTFVAQAAAQKNELTGILGRTFVSNQGISGAPSYDPELRFGNGLTFEVNYARQALDAGIWALALEVPFVVDPVEDLHAAQNLVPKKYTSFFVTPAARVNLFPDAAVSPWVSFFKWATDALAGHGTAPVAPGNWLAWVFAVPVAMTLAYGGTRIVMGLLTQWRDGIFAISV